VTRIIAGSARGRRLSVPAGRDTRPTAGRTREALFSTLAGLTDLAGARFLDLYAGSGAVGLEAHSRGAIRVVLVEADPAAAAVIADNIAAVAPDGARVVRRSVERFLADPPDERFDVVFADPPYELADPELRAGVAAVAEGWTGPGAVVVVERPSRGGGWVWPSGVEPIKARRYGEGTLWYGRRS
jgi:16S rRNA (guanine966-N2)-methyltransferase